MLPPGRLYQANPIYGPDVSVFKDIDFAESKSSSVIFKDEMNFIGLQASPKLGVIFEVKAYDPRLKKDVEPQQIGWCYFPLFRPVENEDGTISLYTNQHQFQVPLFKGVVYRKSLLTALRTDDPLFTLQKDPDLAYLEPAQLIVRIQDNQQEKPENIGMEVKLDSRMVLGGLKARYFFNERPDGSGAD